MADLEYAEWLSQQINPKPCDACGKWHKNIDHVFHVNTGWTGCSTCWQNGFANIVLGDE